MPGPSKSQHQLDSTESNAAVEALRKFKHNFDNHDFEANRKLFTSDASVLFADFDMSAESYLQEAIGFFESFPDVSSKIDSIEILGPNKAIMRGFQTSGTHSKPYAVGPYPAIEPTGIKCVNDKEDLEVVVDEHGKISVMKVVARGENTGPQGFYAQIGGLIF